MRKREQRRQALQAELDEKRSTDYRRHLGQFATPPELASEIVSYGLSLMGGRPIRFLEPAVGTGSFFSALLACAGSEGVESATGLEVDGEVGEAAKTLWGDRLDVIVGDFAQAPPVGPAANLLISNPPYVRHHYIGSESIDVLDLSFHVFNKDTWDTVFDSDMISIGFN